MAGPEDFPEFSELMPCYEANPGLEQASNDGRCEHCRKFLTADCEYVDQFLEEDEA